MGNCYNVENNKQSKALEDINPDLFQETNPSSLKSLHTILKPSPSPSLPLSQNPSTPVLSTSLKKLYSNGNIYKGNLKDKKPDDIQGYYLDKTGFEYKGGFKSGQFSGFGEAFWKDGKFYKGNFEFGNFHGKGEFGWPDGRRYVGEYRFGVKHGEGKIFIDERRFFEGKWKNGCVFGNGVFCEDGVEKVRGKWESGRFVREE